MKLQGCCVVGVLIGQQWAGQVPNNMGFDNSQHDQFFPVQPEFWDTLPAMRCLVQEKREACGGV